MKIQYESELGYQKEAIESIVDIFQGQDKCEANFTVYSPEFLAAQSNLEYNDLGYGNRLLLTEGQIVQNVQNIQLANGLKPSERSEIDRNNLDFTVEMETGTGKTYVYLRTIMELYRRYGFSKHIIVVPSIPIKEGVFASLKSTQDHFRALYDNVKYNFFVYDSSKLNEVRDFATNDSLEIMVINIDAFRKSFEDPKDEKKTANIIHRYNDSLGYKPLDLIKNTNPIVLIDEPQSTMSTPLAKKAVQSLNPLAMVRYSATHKEKVNLMFKLDAVDAYEKKLVKQIEVGSVEAEGSHNSVYIRLVKINLGKGAPTCDLEVDILKNGSVSREIKKNLKSNTDLEQITGRTEYAGFIINDIHGVEGQEYIDFTSNDKFIRLGEAIGNVEDGQVKRALIRKTIEEHLDKELVLNPLGIKVLSLFFIDTVSKYRVYDEDGNQANGEYADIFEDEYKKAIRKPKYTSLFKEIADPEADASRVHSGYFSIDKKSKRFKDSKEDKEGNVKANAEDEDTFKLIMQDKEDLLSFSTKLRFIFSHSALKEGWDNPNVFQICTLKEAGASEVRRRQEIGRGLRLCVNQEGNRVYGHEVNILTVMASESYVEFVDNLQKEIEKDTGIKFGIIQDHSFNNIVVKIEEDDVVYLGQQKSEELFNYLLLKGYVDSRGKVQDLLRIDLKEDKVELPDEFTEEQHVLSQILTKLKDAAGRLEIKNKDDKKPVKVNRKVLDSVEFRELWDRVKHRTTFSVNFDSDKLIQECIQAIDNRLQINRGKIIYTKTSIKINAGGVVNEAPANYVLTLDEKVDKLPDIVTYLQNETQLTRKSIVKILTGTSKLGYFKVNPQKFIEGCIDILNEQMRMHIVDGIKYHKIGDAEYYSQELFQNEELFGYINKNLKESTKSPFEYVVYDSVIESRLAQEFEQSDNVTVYAKLPGWFKIDTPLGTYNPDWAILWKDDKEEKLYFVVESKGATGLFDLRPKEQGKIDCGKKHFEALGTHMIVASEMTEVVNYVMEK
ncbi:DEAD/DEAH box helicase family protein [Crocinitomicaceae bacterium CZZ-1]|uniref:DEAD/DEAH box helicase family protein n=1 Tax=Taishania pollutisoli TaxID=2766479 RepID=A0A8J6PJD8_9FLAO|nr:DEAD/DEAH box helicase family protein [Taishania pollutisoli]MBC9812195.1 DEAD/DEAH box helicase family protein [Taishania pollutisoli]